MKKLCKKKSAIVIIIFLFLSVDMNSLLILEAHSARTNSLGEPFMDTSNGTSVSSVSANPLRPKPIISISKSPSRLSIGESAGLSYTIDNAEDTCSSVMSNDTSIIRVNSDKTLTAVGEGEAAITIKAKNVSKTFTVAVNAIPVEGVKIQSNLSRIQLGSSRKLNVSVSPNNASNNEIIWKSDNPNIIKVDQKGNITGKSLGITRLSCQSYNGITDECIVEVYEVVPDEVKTTHDTIKMECGTTFNFGVTILPENANNKNYEIKIEDDTIAIIDENLNIKGLKDGNTQVIIQTTNDITKYVPISVYHEPVKNIDIDDSSVKYILTLFKYKVIDYREPILLYTRINPKNATYKQIEWRTSNPDVVKVVKDDFIVRGTGRVVLTARGHDDISQEIVVYVIDRRLIGIFLLAGGFAFVIFLFIIKEIRRQFLLNNAKEEGYNYNIRE